MPRNTFDLELVARREEVPNVERFTFRRTDGEEFTFVPGQFLMLHYEDGEGEFQRSYSLSSIAEVEPDPEISVSWVEDGRGCRQLWALKPGDRVQSSGPYGRFTLRGPDPQRYLFIGTGTGVAPYRTMLPALRERATRGIETHIVLGVRRPEELLFGGEFQAFAEAHDSATFHACYSRCDAPADQSFACRGYVTARLKELQPDPDRDMVYLCGNPAMVDDAVAHLLSVNFSPRNIRREKYIS